MPLSAFLSLLLLYQPRAEYQHIFEFEKIEKIMLAFFVEI